MSNKETEESAIRLEAIYNQIVKEASEAALIWPWGYSQRDYDDGKPRHAMVVNAMRKEYYKLGAIPYGEKLHEAQEILREVFQKHESGLLPDRFVYDKIKKFLYGE